MSDEPSPALSGSQPEIDPGVGTGIPALGPEPEPRTIWFRQSEGFGSFLQMILRVYLEVYLLNQPRYSPPAGRGLIYVHTDSANFEHQELEHKTRAEWCQELNYRICHQYLPRDRIRLRSELSETEQAGLVSDPGNKRYLDCHLNEDPTFLQHLRANYLVFTQEVEPTPTYFSRDRVNVALHLRNFMPTDCDPGATRELFTSGGDLEAFYHRLIQQLDGLPWGVPVHFWLYVQDPGLAVNFDPTEGGPAPAKRADEVGAPLRPTRPEYLPEGGELRPTRPEYPDEVGAPLGSCRPEYPNLTVVSGQSLNSDLYHFIQADVLVLSKSSLSCIANYYRADHGVSLIRPGFWHALTPGTLELHTQPEEYPLSGFQTYQLLDSVARYRSELLSPLSS